MDTPGWTSIRPWIPPLTLSVREITSVSVTFILSASSAPLAGEPDIAALLEDIQHRGEDEADGDEEDNSTSNSESEAKKPSSSPPSVVSRALAGGLSVEVDRGSWRRVFIRIDDKADEAVIIVYGLMPGRQYDVDLELVQGQTTMRSQVVTQEDNNPSNGTPVEADTSTTPTGNADESTPTRPSTPPNTASTPSQSSSSQQHAQPSGTSFSFAPLTLEDRIAQLQHTLSLLNSETTTLTASLKSARRDSQKADAALRTEIEVLRRASERHNAGELRAKQKVLALQEAVKRANSSVTETKSETQQTEEAYPELESERNAKEKEHARVLAEAEKMRAEREREEEVVRKRIDGYKSELNALCKTQEKLETKQEKVENGTVKELQEKLDLVERELEELELEESMAYALAQAGARPLGPSLGIGLGSIGQPNRPLNIPEIPSTVITRPLAGPIGLPRPPPKTSSIPSANSKAHVHNHSLPHHIPNYGHQTTQSHHNTGGTSRSHRSSSVSASHVSHHSHPTGPHSHGPHGPHHLGGRHSHGHGHHDRSHTAAVPTTILTNPNRHSAKASSSGSLPTTPNAMPPAGDSSSEGSSSSPGHGYMNAAKVTPSTSTLSSRAAPFEPSKGFGMGMGLLRASQPKTQQ